MAVEGVFHSKNPKTLSLRKLLEDKSEKVTFLWVPGSMRKPGNEIADKEAKIALEYDLLATKNTHHKIRLTGSTQKTRKQEK
jgi:ribonuclease HI